MKRLSVILLSTAAICAFASATPAVAQEIMDPEGPAPITAEPPHTASHGPGNGQDVGPFAGLGAIFAGHAIAGSSADTTQPKARCRVTLDFNDAHARPTTVCD